MSGATAAGQLIAVASLPIVGRLYSPGDYGHYVQVLSLVTLVGAVASLRLDQAVPLADSESDAHLVTLLSIALAGLVCLTVGAVLAFSPLGRSIFGDSSPLLASVTVVVVGMFTASFGSLTQLAIRARRYGDIARRNILQPSVMVVLQVAFGLLGSGWGWLAAGLSGGRFAGTLSLASPLLESRNLDWRRAKILLFRFRKFPLIAGPTVILNTLSLTLPPIIALHLFGSAEAGYFGLANTVIAMPVVLIGTAVGRVFVGEIALLVRRRKGGARAKLIRASRTLGVLSVGVGLAITVLAPWGVGLVMGAPWKTAGDVAQALVAMSVCRLIVSPISPILAVLEHQWVQLVADSMRIVVIAVVSLGARQAGWSLIEWTWALSLGTSCTYLFTWISSWKVLSQWETRIGDV